MADNTNLKARTAKISKDTGGVALTIPMDLGDGPISIKIGVTLVSAPTDIFEGANALYAERRFEEAVANALTGECSANWNGSRNRLDVPFPKALSDALKHKIKDTM